MANVNVNGVGTWDDNSLSFTLVRKLNTVDDKKDNNARFYTRRSGLEIQPSTALKFLTIIERKAKN